MTPDESAVRHTLPGQPPTDEDLEHEVALTRQEISETVAELAHRMNVKARAREATGRVRAMVVRHRAALAATGGGLLLVVLVIAVRNR